MKATRRAEFLDDIDIAYRESEIFETEDLTRAVDDNDSEEYCQLRAMGLTHPETKGAK